MTSLPRPVPRLATLPFDPTYKSCTCKKTTDQPGKQVGRCFVKGAAPAVMDRAASTLSGGTSIPCNEELDTKSQIQVQRLGGEGLRVMAAAFRHIDPAAFDPAGELTNVTGLRMTNLVGVIAAAKRRMVLSPWTGRSG